jgi:hypothetical protein
VLTAGLGTTAKDRARSEALIGFLTAPAAMPVIKAKSLQPSWASAGVAGNEVCEIGLSQRLRDQTPGRTNDPVGSESQPPSRVA